MKYKSMMTILFLAVLTLCVGVGPVAASNSEDGGSGLVRVDYAWSMPFRGVLFSNHVGFFSSEGTPGSARYMTLTPSLTKGLSNGFEGAVALPFEILTSGLDDSDFERRFDARKRDLLGKLRWSGPLSGPNLRVGVQGIVAVPLLESSTRPGGDAKPPRAFDAGAMALLSANVGWIDFPIRIHANAGYWWSRDDGAVYMRQLPGALPLSGADIVHNDLLLGGLAIEAGLTRFVLFAELLTEHLVGARAQVRGRENLWRLTPGVRTELGQNISLTAGVTFDLSKDDPRTAFNPRDTYPDIEFRAGLLLGTVLTRQRYERSRRRDQIAWEMEGRAERAQAAAVERAAMADREERTTPIERHESVVAAGPVSVEPAFGPVPERTPEPATVRAASPSPAPISQAVPPASSEELRALEERLSRLELQMRLAQIEARLRELEAGKSPLVSSLPAPRQVAAPAPAPEPIPAPTPAPTPAPDPAPASPPAAAAPTPAPTAAPAPIAAPAPTPAPAPISATTHAPTPTPASPAARVEPREDIGVRISVPDQPAVSVVPVAPAAALGTARDLEAERLWAEIDQLAKEFLEIGAEIASPPPAPPVPPVVVPDEPPSPAVAASTPSFLLAYGERALVAEVDLLAIDPLADGAARKSLEAWAELLTAYPDVQVVLLAHVDGGDRDANLSRSTELAKRLRDYLVIAGAPQGSVVALGMGSAEPVVGWETENAQRVNTRLEIERLR